MKKLLVKIFPFLFKTSWHVKPAHEVQLAFTHEGVEYFMFVNEQNMPAERAFAAMDVYEELNQRITREYLEELFKGLISCVNKGDLVKVSNLVTFAQQRLQHITNVEILYKLASVLYFTKEENCYNYDREYNEKKIKGWKKSRDIAGFFFENANVKLSSLFRWLGFEYPELYPPSKQRNAPEYGTSFVHVILQRQRDRYDHRARLADSRTEEMERIAKMSVKEYHDYQMAIIKKNKKHTKPTTGGTPRNRRKGADKWPSKTSE